MPSNATLGAL